MNSSAAIKNLESLADRVRRAMPAARVDFEAFPSGSGMLNVFQGDHQYQFVYSTTHRLYSFDEIGEDESFLLGYRHNVEDFEPAAEQFWQLIVGREDGAVSPEHVRAKTRD